LPDHSWSGFVFAKIKDMQFTFLNVIFILLFIDAIGANLFVWFGGVKWWHKQFRTMSRNFPVNKFLAGYYLLLVIFIGYLLVELGQISLQ